MLVGAVCKLKVTNEGQRRFKLGEEEITMWEMLLIESANGNAAKFVKSVRCLDFINRCSAHMYTEIHERRDCYAPSCS